MRKVLLSGLCCAMLSACVTPRPTLVHTNTPWEPRMVFLQQAAAWQLEGRAAVAVGKQGWQASLNWSQSGDVSEVHLAGPLGVGALLLKKTAAGLSINGAPPGDAMLPQLQDRLGFDLPLDELRFWLLGVPNPGEPFDLVRNDRDRAETLTQAGWTLEYDRYVDVDGNTLPGHLVMSRADVRVRVVVDHWTGVK